MKARFSTQGEADFVEIVAYLDREQRDLGDRFAADVHEALRHLVEFPFSGPRISGRARKKRLHTFSYNVLYVIHEQEILVVGIVHHRRGSRVMRERLRALRKKP